jgi:hypothetical protein
VSYHSCTSDFSHADNSLIFSGCVISLASISFILAEAIPIFNYIIALTGSICYAPLCLILPGVFWLYDHNSWRTATLGQQLGYWAHWLLIVLGVFVLIGGSYGVIQEIIDAYASGFIGENTPSYVC